MIRTVDSNIPQRGRFYPEMGGKGSLVGVEGLIGAGYAPGIYSFNELPASWIDDTLHGVRILEPWVPIVEAIDIFCWDRGIKFGIVGDLTDCGPKGGSTR